MNAKQAENLWEARGSLWEIRALGVEVREITPWHWSVEDELYIYPTKKKFTVIGTEKYYHYKDLVALVRSALTTGKISRHYLPAKK